MTFPYYDFALACFEVCHLCVVTFIRLSSTALGLELQPPHGLMGDVLHEYTLPFLFPALKHAVVLPESIALRPEW